jgi:uncharacterized phage protein (TIGR01671 family)
MEKLRKMVKKMREIIFRGKTEAGNWVEGTGIAIGEQGVRIHYSDHVNVLVIPETVGQYTGFADKNGKKIFEGDVLKMNNTDLKCGAISFMRGSFCLTSIEERVIYRADIGYIEQCGVNCAEVIGNIYDNPELIKEQ